MEELFGVAEEHDSNPLKIGLAKLKARGAKFVSVNPVQTGYSAIADEWLGIRPGTDGLLILSLVHELLRSGAGFHVLKLLERRGDGALRVTQTHARHILLRPSAQLSAEAAQRRLAGFREQIESGRATFEALARENSEDGSAVAGGDLGWTSPGTFVPEFEQAKARVLVDLNLGVGHGLDLVRELKRQGRAPAWIAVTADVMPGTEAMVRDADALDECLRLMQPLRDAWTVIGDSPAAQRMPPTISESSPPQRPSTRIGSTVTSKPRNGPMRTTLLTVKLATISPPTILPGWMPPTTWVP